MNPSNAPPDEGDIYNVLYCSHATELMTDAELQRIIQTSQTNNPGRGVTGLLVYGGGMFLQWLEGPRQEVEKLMRTLAADPRHETIVRLQVLGGMKERLYPAWAMQNVTPEAIRGIMLDCLSRSRSKGHSELIRLMIELLETDQLVPLQA